MAAEHIRSLNRHRSVAGDRVVDAVDDGGGVRKGLVRLNLAHGLLDGFGAERTSNFLQGEQFGCRGVLYKVNIAEAALPEQAQDLEGPTIDLEGRRAGEAVQAVAEGVYKVL